MKSEFHRSMTIDEIAREAVKHWTIAMQRRDAESASFKEQGLPHPDAPHFENDADREAFHAKGQKYWKEVKFAITEREKDYHPDQIISEQIVPAMYVLSDWIYQRKDHSPLGPFPVCEKEGLDIAAYTDPETGNSVRARRWNSDKGERLAFEICSKDYQPQDALVGPFLTA